MKENLFLLGVLISIFSSACQQSRDNLIKIVEGDFDEIGAKCGYINALGDTVIPLGKYYYCYTDTLVDYAIVLEKGGSCIAIDKKGNQIFEVFWFDNGPDPVHEGLFRIIKEGKIGYANTDGQIVIKPLYDCAFPFNNGKAKVSIDCSSVFDG